MSKSFAIDRVMERFETLINKESFLPAKYLRDEIADWTPRIVEVE